MPVSGVHVHDQDPSKRLGRVSPVFGQHIWHDVGRCRPLLRSSLGWQHRRGAGGGYHRFVARGGVPSDTLARRASVLIAPGAGCSVSGPVTPMVALPGLIRVHRRSICCGRTISIRPQKSSRPCRLTPLSDSAAGLRLKSNFLSIKLAGPRTAKRAEARAPLGIDTSVQRREVREVPVIDPTPQFLPHKRGGD